MLQVEEVTVSISACESEGTADPFDPQRTLISCHSWAFVGTTSGTSVGSGAATALGASDSATPAGGDDVSSCASPLPATTTCVQLLLRLALRSGLGAAACGASGALAKAESGELSRLAGVSCSAWGSDTPEVVAGGNEAGCGSNDGAVGLSGAEPVTEAERFTPSSTIESLSILPSSP